MLICRNERDYLRARARRWFGIDRARRTPSEEGQAFLNVAEIGFKYHMNEIAAACGLSQLATVRTKIQRRRELNQHYRQILSRVAGLRLLKEGADRQSSSWLFTACVERRLDFIRALKGRGIEAASWHRRLDRNKVFGGLRNDLPNQEAFDEMQVSIPLRDDLKDSEVSLILESVLKGW